MEAPEKYHTGWRRFFSSWIDGLLLGVLAWPVYAIVGDATNESIWVEEPMNILYLTSLTYFFGATLGKKLLGLAVVDAQSERRITLVQSLLRESGLIVFFGLQLVWHFANPGGSKGETLGTVIGWGTFIWFALEMLTMLFHEKRRALHDLIAGTVVINAAYSRKSIEAQSFS